MENRKKRRKNKGRSGLSVTRKSGVGENAEREQKGKSNVKVTNRAEKRTLHLNTNTHKHRL